MYIIKLIINITYLVKKKKSITPKKPSAVRSIGHDGHQRLLQLRYVYFGRLPCSSMKYVGDTNGKSGEE